VLFRSEKVAKVVGKGLNVLYEAFSSTEGNLFNISLLSPI